MQRKQKHNLSKKLAGLLLRLNPNTKWTFTLKPVFYLQLSAMIILSASCMPDQEMVNIYSSRHYQVDEDLFDRFTEETGIRVNLVKAGSDQLIKRLELEGEHSNADILFTVDAGRLQQAVDLGLLQPSPGLIETDRTASHLRDPDGYWWPVTKRARVIVFHKDRVASQDISGYESLTSEKFEGRVLMRSSTNNYNQSLLASFVHHWGREAALDWASGIVNNLARRPSGNDRDQIIAIAAGEGDITIANTYYLGLLKNSANKEERRVVDNVELYFPENTHINVSGIAITKSSNNTENAKKLIKFMLSEEAQKALMNRNFEYPALASLPYEGLLAEWGNFSEDTTNLYNIVKNRNDAVRIFSEAGWR